MADESFFDRVSDPARFRAAIHRFDEINAQDPNREMVAGQAHPRELLHAERLTHWVLILAPDASEELRLAARCQHLCRWMIPRDRYPMTRAGYHEWRNELRRFHALKSGEVLLAAGYPEEFTQRVQDLNLKKNFPSDPDCRVLEDALCLVFLQFQLADLASRTDETKVINALRKSWKKMTEAARAQALGLSYSAVERELLQKALQDL